MTKDFLKLSNRVLRATDKYIRARANLLEDARTDAEREAIEKAELEFAEALTDAFDAHLISKK